MNISVPILIVQALSFRMLANKLHNMSLLCSFAALFFSNYTVISMLVVATSGTGYILGSGSAIDYMGLCCTCAGTMMVAASASTLNQANMLAAGLGASNLVFYAFVYTPLKQIHPINTWVGAIVGAIPSLLGWAVASGQVSFNEILLPAALYFWQIPYFMALEYMCHKDYADGGYIPSFSIELLAYKFRMFSLADASGQRTASVALRNCLYLLSLGYLAYDWGLTSGWFCLESALLDLAISCTTMSFYLNRTIKDARRMFHANLLYLAVFMSGLRVHHVTESEKQMTIGNIDKIVDMLPLLETLKRHQKEKG
ncbi:Protoheme IX farnesyltransferase, mitochondrial [Capsicum annuum]|uniref:Heme O synthase n=1 Tax=Capsicum annuum TaxID=4072 RepID=A0A2G2ZH59_CAPAN|nr:Protoheme IX farnesyltransferase, mitochondrial [Capsicum annuum]